MNDPEEVEIFCAADPELLGSAFRGVERAWGDGQVKYPDNPWRTKLDHLQHAMEHLDKYAAGDRSEDHLAHAQFRIAALYWQDEQRLDKAQGRNPAVL